MASEYTTHYNLDLYTDTDKPNLRDQYNGAMNKIDSQLNTLSNNIVIATEAANQAKELGKAASDSASANSQSIETLQNTVSGIDTAYKAADSSITDAYKAADTKLSSDITAAYKAADTKLSSDFTAALNTKAPASHASADTTYGAGDATHYGHVKLYNAVGSNADGAITPAAVQSALSNINTSIGDGSITTQKIADGAVTAAKIAQSAKDAIMGGITIKVFGNKIPGTDNTGASYPPNMEMAGAYIPALDLLVIWKIHIVTGANWSSTNPLVLPSYVPSMHQVPSGDAQFGIAGIEWTNENYFKSWYGIVFDGRKMYTSSTINDNFDSVPLVISCAPFRDGDSSATV